MDDRKRSAIILIVGLALMAGAYVLLFCLSGPIS